jgi:threonine dehydrogenase-like Zn-dependent dehydrogenase
MRALCWHGKGDVRVDTVPDPKIHHPRDAIIKITACAICGSELHLLDGYQPTMEAGDILGHENMGDVIELGSEVTHLRKGDRVVVPFTISCGQCWFCQKGLFSCCDTTNHFDSGCVCRHGRQDPHRRRDEQRSHNKTGQTHVQAYTKPLLKKIEEGKIDPSFVVTHPASLEDAPAMYKKFRDKKDGVIKVVLRPRT